MRYAPRLALAAALLPFIAPSVLAQDSSEPDLGGAADVSASMRAYAQGPGRASQAAAAAAKPAGVDLSGQFADPADRNQGAVGSCHAFGSIAVLEAAYFRRYGRRIRLSEEDLFLRRTVLTGDVYSQFCASGKCELSEGGDPAADIRYVLDNGVLTGGAYQAFAERYLRYRKAEQETLEGIAKERADQGWLEKLLYDPREHWVELQTDGQAKRLFTDYLEGRDPNSDAERAKVKAALAGFQLRSKSYPFLWGAAAAKLSAADCRAKGAAQYADISAELAAGRPVAIAMSLSGLPVWGQTDSSKHAEHAFVLLGESDASGKRVFHSRNSWGGLNPDVPESQLCRVYGVFSVLAPGESAKF
ncbi:MAG TPA: C1 family peptidase [Elusimicrobiota bacterium]|jgi:hypothetical protein|nr:C1 family peptidase [Elusimicrobiota bacterium]